MATSRNFPSRNDEDLLFYDIEVTEYDSLVVFMDINKTEVAHFWNNRDRDKLDDPSGYEDIPCLIKDKVLVGYNNYFYDDHILTAMMNQTLSLPKYIKAINDTIINGGGYKAKVSELITSLDTMQQIDVSKPSLKQIEGNMGISIVESTVDFNIGRPLTDDERDEMLFYCRHDVAATVDIYKLREKSYFEAKEGLCALLPEGSPDGAYRWNTTTLAANILLGSDKLKTSTDKGRILDKYWRNIEGIPSQVWDMWDECLEETRNNIIGKGKSKSIKAHGCTYVFGMGGLHGAPSKPLRCGRVKHKDVASMYPSSIVFLGALDKATETYDEMRKERIRIKKTDPVKAAAYKIILNSVYGNFKNRYSALNNPMASASVCIYGQIALFSLCRELNKAGYRIINANTDGVVYEEDPRLRDYDEVIHKEWEEEFSGFRLETDFFTEWIQKDVNNYIAIEEDGHITVKGGETNKYDTNKFFSNNSTRIVQIAMVNKLVYGKDPFDTFAENLDKPMLWQFILKAGSTFKGVQNASGEWQNKVNRVFAAAKGVPYTKLYKIRQDDGQVNFPDVPERMFIWNEDVKKLKNFKDIVDQGYYYHLVSEKLKGWPS